MILTVDDTQKQQVFRFIWDLEDRKVPFGNKEIQDFIRKTFSIKVSRVVCRRIWVESYRGSLPTARTRVRTRPVNTKRSRGNENEGVVQKASGAAVDDDDDDGDGDDGEEEEDEEDEVEEAVGEKGNEEQRGNKFEDTAGEMSSTQGADDAEKKRLTRSCLTNAQKYKVCVYMRELEKNTPFVPNRVLVDYVYQTFKITVNTSTVSRLRQQAEARLANGITPNPSVKRQRAVMFPELDRKLVEFIKECQENQVPLTEHMVVAHGKELAQELQIPAGQMAFSDGWMSKFKLRHGIILHTRNQAKTVKKTGPNNTEADDTQPRPLADTAQVGTTETDNLTKSNSSDADYNTYLHSTLPGRIQVSNLSTSVIPHEPASPVPEVSDESPSTDGTFGPRKRQTSAKSPSQPVSKSRQRKSSSAHISATGEEQRTRQTGATMETNVSMSVSVDMPVPEVVPEAVGVETDGNNTGASGVPSISVIEDQATITDSFNIDDPPLPHDATTANGFVETTDRNTSTSSNTSAEQVQNNTNTLTNLLLDYGRRHDAQEQQVPRSSIPPRTIAPQLPELRIRPYQRKTKRTGPSSDAARSSTASALIDISEATESLNKLMCFMQQENLDLNLIESLQKISLAIRKKHQKQAISRGLAN